MISVSNRGWQAVIKLVKLGRHYHIAVSTRMTVMVIMMITREMNADDYRSGVVRKKERTQQFSVAS